MKSASRKAFKILLVHAWTTGNVGDVMHGFVLAKNLKEIKNVTLDLAGCLETPAENWKAVLDHVGHYLPENPRDPLDRPEQRKELFKKYDCIISMPGPFLSNVDARKDTALSDLQIAKSLGIPFIFANHSIGPLHAKDFEKLKTADLIIAREPKTYNYLRRHHVATQLSSDLAFLYPSYFPGMCKEDERGEDFTLAFLRFDNMNFSRIRKRRDGNLSYGYFKTLTHSLNGKVVLATSDRLKDAKTMNFLADRLGVPFVICDTPDQLFSVIQKATRVVSDRYHPGVCAFILGKKTTLLMSRNKFKMQGLKEAARSKNLDEMIALSKAGIGSIKAMIEKFVIR